MNPLSSSLFVIVLVGAALAGALQLRSPRAGRPAPVATISTGLAIAVPSTLQLLFPNILRVAMRDPDRFWAGEWWRLVTALFVQDGGVAGTIFNLVSLGIVGAVAEQLWGRARWLLIFFAGGAASQLFALAWQPCGAGNSVANFSLAGSVALLGLRSSGPPAQKVAATASLAAAVALVLCRDIHGPATALGAALGPGIGLLRPKSGGPRRRC